jgi:predicted RND superfamily exporter protein
MISVGTKIGNVTPVFPKIEPFVEEKKDKPSSPVISNDLTKEDIDRLIKETGTIIISQTTTILIIILINIGASIRELKAKKADKESLKPVIDSLLQYKNRYKELNDGIDWTDKA